MSHDRVIVVAVEDLGTAGVVAVAAAHFAMECAADRLVLLHVLDEHAIANVFRGFAGVPEPVVEMAEEGTAVLTLAEAAIDAEYGAVEQPKPVVARELGEGRPGPVIAGVAAEVGAEAIVVGTRRPHAFGRLTHPDVVEYLRKHTAVPVHVVALQAEPM